MMIDFEQPVDATVSAAIFDALEPFREELAIGDVQVVPAESHTGDPVIRIRLEHQLDDDLKSKFPRFHFADQKVRAAVRDKGERRFVLLDHKFVEPSDRPANR